MELPHLCYEFGRIAKLCHNFPKSLTTDCVKCFGKGHVEVHSLFLNIINNINYNTTNLFDADLHPEGILLNISLGLHAPQSLPSEVKSGEHKFGAFVKDTYQWKGKEVSMLL